MNSSRTLPLLSALSAAILAPALPCHSQTQQTQTVPLQSGWNLIAFQVNPANPAPSAVFGALGGNFKAAFTYDATTKTWTAYQNAATPGLDPAANTLSGVEMANIQLGKGYWVWMNNAQTWSLTGTVPAITPALTTVTGWNLIGVPAGATNLTERVGLLAVLTRAGFNYDQLLKWESSVNSYKKAAVTKTDGTTTTGDTEMRFFDPNAGYWVDVTDPTLLQPHLNVTLRADLNREPYSIYPGPEDENVSGGSVQLKVENQTHIRFFPGEQEQTISLSNTGGGILIWTASCDPPLPWITLASSATEKVGTTELNGVTTVENDKIFLRLDRKNLPKGRYTGKFKLLTSAASTQPDSPVPGLQEYIIVAEVPPVEGEFRGTATVHTVNGKRNAVPTIDLALCIYGDLKVPDMLRGFIDSRNALLWPFDVPLAGYYKSNHGNAFQISGGFILPPGDQNYEPYDVFLGEQIADKDADWNDNERVDAINPLPFPIQRSVFFDGALVSGDPINGHVISGRYTEVIHGMMREPITLEGVFTVTRGQTNAFASRVNLLAGAAADTAQDHVMQAVNSAAFAIAPNATQTRDVTVITELEIAGLTMDIDWGNFTLPGTEHGNFRIKLIGPARAAGLSRPELLLYDSQIGAVGWETLKNLEFPDNRPTQGDLSEFLVKLQTQLPTEVTPRADGLDRPIKTAGTWTLSVQNLGAASVTIRRWALRLYGQPVFDVHGLVSHGSGLVGGAQISIAGQPLAGTTLSASDGSFVLRRVPGMPLNLTATHPAFESNTAGLAASFLTPNLAHNSGSEENLKKRFRPLSGVPPAGLAVPGFSTGGSSASPLPLTMDPVSSAITGRIVTDPGLVSSGRQAPFDADHPRAYVILWGWHENNENGFHVTFHAHNASAASSLLWTFNGGTTETINPVTRRYNQPKTYNVKLDYQPGPVADYVQVVVMPTPNHVVANVVEVDPDETGKLNYTVFCFNPSFTGGGSLPNPNPDGDSATADNPVVPIDVPLPSEPPRTDFVMLQHCHCASFDLDLAPRGTINSAFSNETPPFDPGRLFSSHPSNRASSYLADFGFEEEDHNYTLRDAPDRIDGLPVPQWVVEDAELNLTIDVANDQGWNQEDATLHPVNRGPGASTSTVTESFSRYILTCSIGAAISPYGMSPPTVVTSDAYDDAQSPVVRTAHQAAPAMDSGLARNLHYRLTTGPLAGIQGQPLRNP